MAGFSGNTQFLRSEDEEDKSRERTGWRKFAGPFGASKFQPSSEETHLQTVLRDLITYLIFLLISCIVAFGALSPAMYYETQAFKAVLVDASFETEVGETTFGEISTVKDFWGFMENLLPEALYWEYYYSPETNSVGDIHILHENLILGVPRIRQLKVRNDSCVIHDFLRRNFATCYGHFSEENEDTSTFGLGEGTAWTHHTEDKLSSHSHSGEISFYGGGGFYVDLKQNKEDTKALMEHLKKHGWITRGTRVVFLDFTTYNANVNLFCVTKLIFEFPTVGGVITSHSIQAVKLLRYTTSFDNVIFGCELAFIAFICYFTIEELKEIYFIKWRYFYFMWNYVDLTIIMISYVCIAFSIYRSFEVNDHIQSLITVRDAYVNFENLGYWQVQYNIATAICTFIIWIKIFKYISFNKTMLQLSNTLRRCAKDILGFAVMFFVVFIAFAQLGFLLFGTQAPDFQSFGTSVFTLLRTILGEFDYEEIEEANKILGPLYFLSYVFFVFFVLLNMFLAIINDTYSEVKAEISTTEGPGTGNFFRSVLRNICIAIGCGRYAPRDPYDPDVEKRDSDTYKQIKETLKLCNFSDLEIEMFFAKYDIDANQQIDDAEKQKILNYLQGKGHRIEDYPSQAGNIGASSSRSEARPEEIAQIKHRLNILESSIDGMVSKLNTAIRKLEQINMEASK